jgi:hypothetical protein
VDEFSALTLGTAARGLRWVNKQLGFSGASVGAAPDPSLGQFMAGDDYYRHAVGQSLRQSPPNWFPGAWMAGFVDAAPKPPP